MSEVENKPESLKAEMVKSAVEIAKISYEDALQPGAIELGKSLGTLGKSVNSLLMPIRGLVWGLDRIEEYVRSTVTAKLDQRGAKPEHVQNPNPDIAVPAMEAMRYSQLKTEFATLLASAMDSRFSASAHPAFVEILKQIVPDEAKILEIMPDRAIPLPVVRPLSKQNSGKSSYSLSPGETTVAEEAFCDDPTRSWAYVTNLARLGLIEIEWTIFITDGEAYKDLEERLGKRFTPFIAGERHLELEKGIMSLTVLGLQFKRACLM